jgi:hypothetical protein
VRRPDGSHEQLPAWQAAALERILAEREPEMRPERRSNVLAVAFMLAALTFVIVLCGAWVALTSSARAGAPPFVVVSTPATYGPPPDGGRR